MGKLEIEVGRHLRSVAAEVGTTWKAAMAGEPVQGSDRIVFTDWHALCAVLTAERYDLLRALAGTPKSNVSDIAQRLGRASSAVEVDVKALVAIGLVIQGQSGSLSAAADKIASTIRIAA